MYGGRDGRRQPSPSERVPQDTSEGISDREERVFVLLRQQRERLQQQQEGLQQLRERLQLLETRPMGGESTRDPVRREEGRVPGDEKSKPVDRGKMCDAAPEVSPVSTSQLTLTKREGEVTGKGSSIPSSATVGSRRYASSGSDDLFEEEPEVPRRTRIHHDRARRRSPSSESSSGSRDEKRRRSRRSSGIQESSEPRARVRYSNLKLDKYDGTTPLEIFPLQFGNCVNHNQGNGAGKLTQLKGALKGTTAPVLMREQRWEIREREHADLIRERRFHEIDRSHLGCDHCFRIKFAVLIMQRRYRAQKLAAQQRYSYLCLRWAAIVAQGRFRALMIARKVRSQFLELRRVVIVCQRRYRAKLEAKDANHVAESNSTSDDDSRTMVVTLNASVIRLEIECNQVVEDLRESKKVPQALQDKLYSLQQDLATQVPAALSSDVITKVDFEALQRTMKRLEDKYTRVIRDTADPQDKIDHLEHLMHVQGETNSIGGYVSLYRQQRSILRARLAEKDGYIYRFASERGDVPTHSAPHKKRKRRRRGCGEGGEKGGGEYMLVDPIDPSPGPAAENALTGESLVEEPFSRPRRETRRTVRFRDSW